MGVAARTAGAPYFRRDGAPAKVKPNVSDDYKAVCANEHRLARVGYAHSFLVILPSFLSLMENGT